MKNIEPRAELPLVHMTQYANAMPSRPPKGPVKNLTGLYLGLEGSGSLSPRGKNTASPPPRVRGMPSSRIRTPTELQRYKKVELLRIKEERRGFTGQPLKRRTNSGQDVKAPVDPPPSQRDDSLYTSHPPDIDITKQTARNYTPATNSGVTHLEYLSHSHASHPATSPRGYEDRIVDVLARQVHQLTLHRQDDVHGLVDCYKKVCKGNIDTLHSLLPYRQLQPSSQDRQKTYTGFAVKSYRNPNTAEIIAQFPEPRPRTVIGIQRPLVPSPYFFKSYAPSLPRTLPSAPSPNDYYQDNHIIVASLPGAGQVSRSVQRGQHQISRCVNTPQGSDYLRNQHSSKVLGQYYRNSRILQNSRADSRSPYSNNEEVGGGNEYTLAQRDDPEATAREQEVVTPTRNKAASSSEVNVKVNSKKMATSACSKLERMPSGADIQIGLEDEAGTSAPVEIDEADELDELIVKEEEVRPPRGHGRRVSITERVLKSKNSEMQLASITFQAQSRKQQLAELLDEHARLVSQVTVMEDSKGPKPVAAQNGAPHPASHHSDKENASNSKH